MTKLDKPLCRAVSWDRGDFVVSLVPGETPRIEIRPKHGKKSFSLPLPWLWAQMCKRAVDTT
jgi:hypothetical protein